MCVYVCLCALICVSVVVCARAKSVTVEGDEVAFNPNPEFSAEKALGHGRLETGEEKPRTRARMHTHTQTHTRISKSHSISRVFRKLSITWINERMESQNTHFRASTDI